MTEKQARELISPLTDNARIVLIKCFKAVRSGNGDAEKDEDLTQAFRQLSEKEQQSLVDMMRSAVALSEVKA